MDLHHEFTVPVAAKQAWQILCDLERLAPCLPGAQLTEVEGEIYRGQVKVKVGPILAQFKGQASFVSRDDENFRASLKAEGRDTGGKERFGHNHRGARANRRRQRQVHGRHATQHLRQGCAVRARGARRCE